MLSNRILLLLAILGMIMLLMSCNSKSSSITIPTSRYDVPQNEANQILCFWPSTEQKSESMYAVELMNTDYYSPIDTSIQYILVVGATQVVFTYVNYPGLPRMWYSETPVTINPNQQIILKKNGVVVLNTIISPVAKTYGSFPATYDLTLPLNLSWALDTNSQYQFVGVSVWSNISDDGGMVLPESEYINRINSNVRNYSIPASAVSEPAGQGDFYESVWVEQVNYKIVNKIAVMVYDGDGETYNYETPVPKPGFKTRHAMQMYNAISRTEKLQVGR